MNQNQKREKERSCRFTIFIYFEPNKSENGKVETNYFEPVAVVAAFKAAFAASVVVELDVTSC
jgi:hypothetical protein